MKYYVGCSGWRNQKWAKDFYPNSLNPKDYLAYYSKVFDFAELDLSNTSSVTYSKPPNKSTFRKWAKNTPTNFRFSLKLPRQVIIDTDNIGNFLEELEPLEKKVLAIVIQPAMTLKDGREWLDEILDICTYHGYSVALEFDHFSWFQDLAYHILKKHNAALVWSSDRRPHHHGVVPADFLYLRITENEQKWIEKIKEKEEEEDLEFTIVVVDQPAKVNKVLKILDLPEKNMAIINGLAR